MLAKKRIVPKTDTGEEVAAISVLDLPEPTLDCILERIPPNGLCKMAAVCRSLRNRCRSDHLWHRHLKEKWGRLIGPAVEREWEVYVSSKKDQFSGVDGAGCPKEFEGTLYSLLPLSWLRSKLQTGGPIASALPVNSIMSRYLALESGNFRLPAQVYNREKEHPGYILSCYDAKVSYDSRTDTFTARYLPHGRRRAVIEDGVQWERLRAPPVDTAAYDLHAPDCRSDLRPGDHIEIQWRSRKRFPYGWWYAVVGHLDSCGGTEHYCHCQKGDKVVLDFKQYPDGSRDRRITVNRNTKDHKEEGNRTYGFYGGIRKLTGEDIAVWRQMWPSGVLG